MLKVIKLGLAERQVVNLLLQRIVEAKVAQARQIREIRRDLKLREVDRYINEQIEEGQKLGVVWGWDDLLDEDNQNGRAEYTIEEADLRFLQGLLSQTDWTRGKNQIGQDITVPISAGQMEAVANLDEAIGDAIAGKNN
jgi:hypothetical protein